MCLSPTRGSGTGWPAKAMCHSLLHPIPSAPRPPAPLLEGHRQASDGETQVLNIVPAPPPILGQAIQHGGTSSCEVSLNFYDAKLYKIPFFVSSALSFMSFTDFSSFHHQTTVTPKSVSRPFRWTLSTPFLEYSNPFSKPQ